MDVGYHTFMPLVIALIALGGLGTAAYFATRKPDAPVMMLPGQTWQAFGFVVQKKPLDAIGKPIVSAQIVAALAAMGALVIDANWTPDNPVVVDGVSYPTFFMGFQVSQAAPVWKTPATYPLISDWTTDFVITGLAQAPANIPAPIGTIGNAFS
jgi:hypothetical protein